MRDIFAKILEEIKGVLDRTELEKIEEFIDEIKKSKKIYTVGMGRTGLIVKAFAMRLMHLGFNVYVVGETITPRLEEGDLLIAGSGSGETEITCYLTQKAKKGGAITWVLTSNGDSRLAKIGDGIIVIPGTVKVPVKGIPSSIQYGGSLFEQSLLIFTDAVIVRLMKEIGKSKDDMNVKHTNLE